MDPRVEPEGDTEGRLVTVTLIGPAYSVYVRAARIVLHEKGVAYDHESFAVFDDSDIPAGYLERHPFKRVPAFEHDGFRLYETGAITRYVDEAFPGPRLQPGTPRERARMNQVISILDAYAYWPLVRVIFVQRGSARQEVEPDEAAIADALEKAETCLGALSRLIDEDEFLAGEDFTLADAHAVPIFDYFQRTEEGRGLMSRQTALAGWWSRVETRASVVETPFSGTDS